jgi:hypothetical protein
MVHLVNRANERRAAWDLLVLLVLASMGCHASGLDSSPPRGVSRSMAPDTTTPAMPVDWTERLDPALTVPFLLDPSARYYRHRFRLAFKTSASGLAIRQVLARYNATVVGGMPTFKPRGAYIIAIPDPGPDPVKWMALYDSLAAEPTVALAVAIPAGTSLQVNR